MNPKVIFIGGYGRSGSTVFEGILSSKENFFAIGEVRHIWKRSFCENQLCTCGQQFSNCEFWNSVLEEAFGGLKNLDLEEINNLRKEVDRIRYIPHLINSKVQSKTFRDALIRYSQILGKLYLGIQKISGCDFLIDSSKDPIHGFLLNYVPNIELYIFHIVRDSRAVAYSWTRSKIRPEIVNHNKLMPQYPLWRSSNEWLLNNLLIELLKISTPNISITIKYEDFIENLNIELAKIGKVLKMQDLSLSGQIYLGMKHSISGNPIRFDKGTVKLILDNEWIMMMKKTSLYFVSCLTFPLLLLYKYPLRSK